MKRPGARKQIEWVMMKTKDERDGEDEVESWSSRSESRLDRRLP